MEVSVAFTYFFRDLQTLDIAVERIVSYHSEGNSMKIWDAGCASGEEPYALAILLAEKMSPDDFSKLTIYATDLDISNQFAIIIKEGIYPYEKLQRMPHEYFVKYFKPIDSSKNYQIDKLLRDKIVFNKDNLLNLNAPSSDFALVLCKNVLLHQSYEERIEIIKMFHRTLSDKGILAMEHTQKLPEELKDYFEQSVSNAQVYEKK